MTVLVLGASGATGHLLVNELLGRDINVKVVVRSLEKFLTLVKKHKNLSIQETSLLDFNDEELAELVSDCDAVVSCLGHNITFKGLFGHPKRLVKDATKNLCNAIKATNLEKPIKYILMNTNANRNRDLNEKVSFKDKCVIAPIRLLLPPQKDNEEAADFLRIKIGQNNSQIQWTAVRPDNLIDEDKVSKYKVYPSPIRGIVFNSGQTSRINVAYFMAELITDDKTWEKWKGQMPVIYNLGSAIL